MKKVTSTIRVCSVVLSGVLSANCCLASLSESNLWAERTKDKKTPVQMASLPQGLMPTPSSILSQIPKAVSSLAVRQIPSHLQASIPAGSANQIGSLVQAMPYGYGTVRSISVPRNGGKAPVVVQIQDIHMNREAQENIAQTIQALYNSGAVSFIALEGAFEPIDFSRFNQAAYAEATRIVADHLFAENKISGAVHAALGHAMAPLIGVDDAAAHRANVDAYLAAAPVRADVRLKLISVQAALNADKTRVFNKDLLALDNVVSGRREGKVSLGSYLKAISKGQSVTPAVARFMEAVNAESSLDFAAVESQRTRLIEALVAKMDKGDVTALLDRSVAFRVGTLSPAEFYQQLSALCRKSKVEMSRFPAMDAYVRYVLLADQLDMDRVTTDSAALETSALAQAAHTDEERRLLAASSAANLTAKLMDFSLSDDEWKTYLAMRGQAPKIGDMSAFERFYQEAVIRDARMAENVIAQVRAHPASASVLVTGGFHARGIERRLNDAGIAVIAFAPKLTKVDAKSGSDYLSVFLQDKTPLETLFEGEKLFVAPLQRPNMPALAVNVAGTLAHLQNSASAVPASLRDLSPALTARMDVSASVTAEQTTVKVSPRGSIGRTVNVVMKFSGLKTLKSVVMERPAVTFMALAGLALASYFVDASPVLTAILAAGSGIFAVIAYLRAEAMNAPRNSFRKRLTFEVLGGRFAPAVLSSIDLPEGPVAQQAMQASPSNEFVVASLDGVIYTLEINSVDKSVTVSHALSTSQETISYKPATKTLQHGFTNPTFTQNLTAGSNPLEFEKVRVEALDALARMRDTVSPEYRIKVEGAISTLTKAGVSGVGGLDPLYFDLASARPKTNRNHISRYGDEATVDIVTGGHQGPATLNFSRHELRVVQYFGAGDARNKTMPLTPNDALFYPTLDQMLAIARHDRAVALEAGSHSHYYVNALNRLILDLKNEKARMGVEPLTLTESFGGVTSILTRNRDENTYAITRADNLSTQTVIFDADTQSIRILAPGEDPAPVTAASDGATYERLRTLGIRFATHLREFYGNEGADQHYKQVGEFTRALSLADNPKTVPVTAANFDVASSYPSSNRRHVARYGDEITVDLVGARYTGANTLNVETRQLHVVQFHGIGNPRNVDVVINASDPRFGTIVALMERELSRIHKSVSHTNSDLHHYAGPLEGAIQAMNVFLHGTNDFTWDFSDSVDGTPFNIHHDKTDNTFSVTLQSASSPERIIMEEKTGMIVDHAGLGGTGSYTPQTHPIEFERARVKAIDWVTRFRDHRIQVGDGYGAEFATKVIDAFTKFSANGVGGVDAQRFDKLKTDSTDGSRVRRNLDEISVEIVEADLTTHLIVNPQSHTMRVAVFSSQNFNSNVFQNLTPADPATYQQIYPYLDRMIAAVQREQAIAFAAGSQTRAYLDGLNRLLADLQTERGRQNGADFQITTGFDSTGWAAGRQMANGTFTVNRYRASWGELYTYNPVNRTIKVEAGTGGHTYDPTTDPLNYEFSRMIALESAYAMRDHFNLISDVSNAAKMTIIIDALSLGSAHAVGGLSTQGYDLGNADSLSGVHVLRHFDATTVDVAGPDYSGSVRVDVATHRIRVVKIYGVGDARNSITDINPTDSRYYAAVDQAIARVEPLDAEAAAPGSALQPYLESFDTTLAQLRAERARGAPILWLQFGHGAGLAFAAGFVLGLPLTPAVLGGLLIASLVYLVFHELIAHPIGYLVAGQRMKVKGWINASGLGLFSGRHTMTAQIATVAAGVLPLIGILAAWALGYVGDPTVIVAALTTVGFTAAMLMPTKSLGLTKQSSDMDIALAQTGERTAELDALAQSIVRAYRAVRKSGGMSDDAAALINYLIPSGAVGLEGKGFTSLSTSERATLAANVKRLLDPSETGAVSLGTARATVMAATGQKFNSLAAVTGGKNLALDVEVQAEGDVDLAAVLISVARQNMGKGILYVPVKAGLRAALETKVNAALTGHIHGEIVYIESEDGFYADHAFDLNRFLPAMGDQASNVFLGIRGKFTVDAATWDFYKAGGLRMVVLVEWLNGVIRAAESTRETLESIDEIAELLAAQA